MYKSQIPQTWIIPTASLHKHLDKGSVFLLSWGACCSLGHHIPRAVLSVSPAGRTGGLPSRIPVLGAMEVFSWELLSQVLRLLLLLGKTAAGNSCWCPISPAVQRPSCTSSPLAINLFEVLLIQGEVGGFSAKPFVWFILSLVHVTWPKRLCHLISSKALTSSLFSLTGLVWTRMRIKRSPLHTRQVKEADA